MPACWSCARPLDAEDRFCRQCGMGQGKHVPWYYHPAAIAFLTVFALGPLTLPLIWKTPRLETRGRWIMTSLTALFTGYMAYSCYRAFQVVLSILPELR